MSPLKKPKFAERFGVGAVSTESVRIEREAMQLPPKEPIAAVANADEAMRAAVALTAKAAALDDAMRAAAQADRALADVHEHLRAADAAAEKALQADERAVEAAQEEADRAVAAAAEASPGTPRR
jgi:hypothetical protein